MSSVIHILFFYVGEEVNENQKLFIIAISVFAITSACALVGVRDVKAQEGPALTDLIKRIEALESRPGSNVTAGMKSPIRGLKIGFDVRHRFEIRDQMPNANGIGRFDYDPSSGLVAQTSGLNPKNYIYNDLLGHHMFTCLTLTKKCW